MRRVNIVGVKNRLMIVMTNISEGTRRLTHQSQYLQFISSNTVYGRDEHTRSVLTQKRIHYEKRYGYEAKMQVPSFAQFLQRVFILKITNLQEITLPRTSMNVARHEQQCGYHDQNIGKQEKILPHEYSTTYGTPSRSAASFPSSYHTFHIHCLCFLFLLLVSGHTFIKVIQHTLSLLGTLTELEPGLSEVMLSSPGLGPALGFSLLHTPERLVRKEVSAGVLGMAISLRLTSKVPRHSLT